MYGLRTDGRCACGKQAESSSGMCAACISRGVTFYSSSALTWTEPVARPQIVWHPYGVEVFRADGTFAAGITYERMVDGPAKVAEAVQSILEGFGIYADCVKDKAVAR